MNRREFIKGMGACLALAAIPPVLIPGKKEAVSVAYTGAKQGNIWVAPDEMAKIALAELEKALKIEFATGVDMEVQFKNGETITFRREGEFTIV